MPVTIFKLGGSLLDFPDLSGRLLNAIEFVRSQSDEPLFPLIIVGGGALADVVRHWDQTYQLGESLAHELAMSTLYINEMLVTKVVEGASRILTHEEAEFAWSEDRLPILRTADFMTRAEQHFDHRASNQHGESTRHQLLPHTWQVTSDSLAAWVADMWPADRLVLLKSTDLPRNRGWEELALEGYVDRYFPKLSSCVRRLDWLNLRADEPRLVTPSGHSSDFSSSTV